MASHGVDVFSKLSLGRGPRATSKPAETTRLVLIRHTGSNFTDMSFMDPQNVGFLPIRFNMALCKGISAVPLNSSFPAFRQRCIHLVKANYGEMKVLIHPLDE